MPENKKKHSHNIDMNACQLVGGVVEDLLNDGYILVRDKQVINLRYAQTIKHSKKKKKKKEDKEKKMDWKSDFLTVNPWNFFTSLMVPDTVFSRGSTPISTSQMQSE